MTDISPEAVKAFVSANADVTDPVQRRLLDMFTELSAERDRLVQQMKYFDKLHKAEAMRLAEQNDALKAAQEQLIKAAEAYVRSADMVALMLRSMVSLPSEAAKYNETLHAFLQAIAEAQETK